MNKKILIIDDEPAIVMCLSELLSDMDHIVLKAHSGEEGLRLLDREAPPDLVITDLKLPGVSGQEVIRKIRQDPVFDKVPIIIMSGSVFQEVYYPNKSSYQALVAKPFDIEEFLELVTKLIT